MAGRGGHRPSEIDGTIYILSFQEAFGLTASRILAERGVNHRVVGLSWSKPFEPALRRILAEKPAGLILWAPTLKERPELLLKLNCPIVVCAGGLPEWDYSSVRVDFKGGSEVALRHLYKLGHREIAHVCPGYGSVDRDFAEAYRWICQKLNLKKSASRIWQAENTNHTVLREVMLEGRRRNPEVTAIFGNDQVGICATKIFSVPQELSVIGFDGLPEGANCRPPLTTIDIPDQEAVALWGCTNLISQIQTIQSGRPRRPATKVLMIPALVLRKSTRALVSGTITPEISNQPPRKQLDPAATWSTIYPFLKKKKSKARWHQLDLGELANHSLTRNHGWLGSEPLEYFLPGLRSIHGVPFQILDENRNDGRAVVTFRSPQSHTAGEKELPTTAQVPVNGRVKALYFLHGCGYAKPVPFAEYVMQYKGGESSRIALVPVGASRNIALEQLGDLKPNLQDWWPDPYEHEDHPHAHRVAVFNPTEPGVYERFLYSLEWINPKPEEEIETIEVRVDPTAGPTLALLAVTALL